MAAVGIWMFARFMDEDVQVDSTRGYLLRVFSVLVDG